MTAVCPISVALATLVGASPLGLDEVLRLADQGPLVAAAEAGLAGRRALAGRTTILPANPTVEVATGARAAGRSLGPELQAALAQPLSLSGLGGARAAAFAREVDHDRAVAREQRQRARLAAAEAWFALWAAQGLKREAGVEVALATELRARVGRALASGEHTRLDAALLRAWVSEARLAELSAEGESYEAGVRLHRVLGLAESGPATAAEALPALAPVDAASLRATVDAAVRAPSVEALRALRDAEEARVAEARAHKGSWLSVGVSGGREAGGDLLGFATLSLSPALFDRGSREAAPFAVAAAIAEGARRDAVAAARAERLRVAYELEHTAETLAEVERELLPASEEAAAFVLRRLEAGEATAQELVVVRRAVSAARGRRVRAAAASSLARVRAHELLRAQETAPGGGDEPRVGRYERQTEGGRHE